MSGRRRSSLSKALVAVLVVLVMYAVLNVVLLLAHIGGWPRFVAAIVVCAVAAIVLPKELRDDRIR